MSGQIIAGASAQAFIDGASTPASGGQTYEVVDPSRGRVIAEVARCGAADVDAAVQAAENARRGWAETPASERSRLLFSAAAALREQRESVGDLEHQNSGKLPAEARNDVDVSARYFEYYAALAEGIEGVTLPATASSFAYTLREPYGVTGHIIPWNFPLHTAARSIAPALAAGNTVVAKPAEETPLTCIELARICTEVGIPAGVINVVTGFGEEAGAPLAAHPGVDRLSFTGSVETGKLVLKAAADHLCYTTVELGGKSPNIVFADAALDAAVAGVARGILSHAGQICSAGSRLLVAADVHDQLVDGLSAEMQRRWRPMASAEPRELAPLISQAQQQKVLGYIESGVAAGATLVTGGTAAPEHDGFYVEPALLTGAEPGMAIVEEEIFGPVLTVQQFTSEDEAVRIANATQFGLAAGVWTRDISRALRMVHELNAGTVYVNGYFTGGVELPFGGFKASGFGREKGAVALEDYTRLKSVSITMI